LDLIGPYCKEEFYHSVLFKILQSRTDTITVETKKQIKWTLTQEIDLTLIPDLIINGTVVELKSVAKIEKKEIHQVNRYLTALQQTTGWIVNFSTKSEQVELFKVDQTASGAILTPV
jgi:GxxExxY protein